mgnify:FL=1
MINYSTCMRGNPTDKDAAKKAYANAQYSQVMTLDKFCYHIASHGCVYSRADIQAILILAVDCLREQLLNGQQIQMGDLAYFRTVSEASAPLRWQSSLWRTSPR